MINIRATSAAFKQQARHFFADPQWVIPSLVAPFTFTIVVLMLFPAVDEPVVLYAVLGGGILGMWGNTLYASGWSVSFDRMNGTLESLLITPTPMVQVVAGRAVWNTLIGLTNAAAVFVVAELAFGTELRLEDPALFFLALAATLLSLATVGLMLSAMFVMTRSSTVLMQILELPIYFISGAMIPVDHLPEAIRPFSYALAPTWGVDAMRQAAGIQGTTVMGLGTGADLLIVAAITSVYLAIALYLFRRMEARARADGSLGRW